MVRQWSAKPLCSGSNPLAAFKIVNPERSEGQNHYAPVRIRLAPFDKIKNVKINFAGQKFLCFRFVFLIFGFYCRDVGTGRQTGLKILGPSKGVRVRFPLPAQYVSGLIAQFPPSSKVHGGWRSPASCRARIRQDLWRGGG